jgi:hypothetical protein
MHAQKREKQAMTLDEGPDAACADLHPSASDSDCFVDRCFAKVVWGKETPQTLDPWISRRTTVRGPISVSQLLQW